MNTIRVIDEWILVKPNQADNTEKVLPSGIVVPGQAQKDDVKRALVLQISSDIKEELHYKVGDTVLYYGKTGITIKDGGEEYVFLKFDGMLAVEVPNASN